MYFGMFQMKNFIKKKKKKWVHIKTYLDLETKLQTLIWQANDKIWKDCTFTIG